jgi:hypothetical protein
MTPGGRPRGGGYNWLAWIDSSIYIYSMVIRTVSAGALHSHRQLAAAKHSIP